MGNQLIMSSLFIFAYVISRMKKRFRDLAEKSRLKKLEAIRTTEPNMKQLKSFLSDTLQKSRHQLMCRPWLNYMDLSII